MRLITPTMYRLGKTNRWTSDQWNLNKNVALTESTVQIILQNLLGNQLNLFVVKCSLVDSVARDFVEVSVVFYKYIQRARMIKSQRVALLIIAGIFKNKPPLYHVRGAQGFIVPFFVINLIENLLQQVFGRQFQVNFFNISQLINPVISQMDDNLLNTIKYFMLGQQKQLSVTKGQKNWPPLESHLEKRWLNPLRLRDSYYRYKIFSNLVYFLDILMIMVYASIYSTSNLLADVIVRGLLRNMKRHKQFLTLIEVILEYLHMFDKWPMKPLDWRIAVYGKIGSGTARARVHQIKTGYLPAQTVSFLVDYTYRQADTKYGSIGVKIWLRRPIM